MPNSKNDGSPAVAASAGTGNAAVSQHTPGPWPWMYTGDGKRIIVGDGLVEGPGGYEVAEVYSDDCSQEVAEANARLIAAAPDMKEALEAARSALDALLGDSDLPEDDRSGVKAMQLVCAALSKTEA